MRHTLNLSFFAAAAVLVTAGCSRTQPQTDQAEVARKQAQFVEAQAVQCMAAVMRGTSAWDPTRMPPMSSQELAAADLQNCPRDFNAQTQAYVVASDTLRRVNLRRLELDTETTPGSMLLEATLRGVTGIGKWSDPLVRVDEETRKLTRERNEANDRVEDALNAMRLIAATHGLTAKNASTSPHDIS